MKPEYHGDLNIRDSISIKLDKIAELKRQVNIIKDLHLHPQTETSAILEIKTRINNIKEQIKFIIDAL